MADVMLELIRISLHGMANEWASTNFIQCKQRDQPVLGSAISWDQNGAQV